MRDDRVYLLDMVQGIELIQACLNQVAEADFEKKFLPQDAVCRRFGVVGKAAGRISEAFRAQYPGVERRLMRNKLSDEHFGISSPTVFFDGN